MLKIKTIQKEIETKMTKEINAEDSFNSNTNFFKPKTNLKVEQLEYEMHRTNNLSWNDLNL